MKELPTTIERNGQAGLPCSDLLAFSVTTEHLDVNVLVFARNRTHAKRVAQRSEWVCEGGVDWIDLRVSREPKADKYATKFGETYIGAETADEQRVLRELGWVELDNSMTECCKCGLHEWSQIPESKICEIGDIGEGICAGCQMKANKPS